MRYAMKYANSKNIKYTDIKIALIENNSCQKSKLVFDELPLPMFEGSSEHSYDTGWVVRQLCPDAKIYLLPRGNDSLRWCLENGIDILSVSLTGLSTTDVEEIKLSKVIFNLIGSGNDGKYGGDTTSLESRGDHWTSIGAAHLFRDKTYLASYSSKGESLDFLGLSGVSNGHKMLQGTSFSTPFVAGLLGQYIQAHYNMFGYKPTPTMIHDFMLENAIDLDEEQPEFNIGNGLFILPKEWNWKPKNAWDRYVLKFYMNGVSKKFRDRLVKVFGRGFWK